MRGAFLSAIDTGVGKTHVGCKLAAFMCARNKKFCVKKPLEAGGANPSDAHRYAKALAYRQDVNTICLQHFSAESSPAAAAKLQNQRITCAQLVEFCNAPNANPILVEGAGGLCSPLCSDALNADLAQALQLPIILVVANRLGLINHSLLNLHYIKKRKLKLAALVINNIDQNQTDYAAELYQHIDSEIAVFDSASVDFAALLCKQLAWI